MTHSMDPGMFGDEGERLAERYAAEDERRDRAADSYWERRCSAIPEPINPHCVPMDEDAAHDVLSSRLIDGDL
jgi:hypothetical protein